MFTPDVVIHAFGQEAKTGELQVWGPPELHGKILSQISQIFSYKQRARV